MPISKRFRSPASSGSANSSNGALMRFSQLPSIAATLIGWYSSVFRPCWSPMTNCAGTRMVASHSVIDSILRLSGTNWARRR